MKRFKREAALLPPVAGYAKRKAFFMQEAELPFYEYRIDLYCFSPAKDITAAFELKLTKWRRALKQALLYQLCADHVYIALPRKVLRGVDTGLLAKHGIGLLAVGSSGRCEQIIEPLTSRLVLPHYRAGFIEVLKETRHALR